MACGGKFAAGTSALMDGSLYPDHVKQLETLGEWYKPRKELFLGAYPIRYLAWGPKGLSVDKEDFKTIACFYRDGVLLHMLNMKGKHEPVEITLKGKRWQGVQSAYLEPGHRPVEVRPRGKDEVIALAKDDIDQIDTIIYLPGVDSM